MRRAFRCLCARWLLTAGLVGKTMEKLRQWCGRGSGSGVRDGAQMLLCGFGAGIGGLVLWKRHVACVVHRCVVDDDGDGASGRCHVIHDCIYDDVCRVADHDRGVASGVVAGFA